MPPSPARWAILLGLIAGCRPVPRTGAWGQFDVVGTLESDTCGPQSMAVPTTVRFRAELGVMATGAASWNVPSSGVSAQGSYDGTTRTFRFSGEDYLQRRPADRYTQRPACVLRRLDVVSGTLFGTLQAVDGGANAGSNDAGTVVVVRSVLGDGGDAGLVTDAAPTPDATASPPRFEGTEVIVYGAVAGAECDDQVGGSDGQFLALPCEQRYRLIGTPVAGE